MDELDSRRYGGLAAEVQTPKSYKVIKLKESKIGLVELELLPYMMRERVAYLWEGWSEGPKPWQFLVNIRQQRAVF